jgi:mannitol-1-/sugar-/sorbitol-6-phosphatase
MSRVFEKSAILFDLDGVLVDSRASVERQWTRWALDHGLDRDAVLAVAHGRRTIETIHYFFPGLDGDAEAADMEERETADKNGVVVMPGARELLARLPPERWAIATSGGRVLATTRLQYVGLPIPRALVTADDVQQGKPGPTPYLEAAREIGFDARDCIVIEDSPAGICSGHAAGAEVIGVATTHSLPEIAHADVLVENISRVAATMQNGKLRVVVAQEIAKPA